MTTRILWGARIACVLALVAFATTFVSGKLPSPATGIDDANIFFVYARNVSAGEGFVFNPGGERVEGFTSLLWVLIGGFITALGSPEMPLLVLNVLLVCGTIALCLRRLNGGWEAAFLILLLSDLSYVVWQTAALMETALWSALLTAAALIAAEEGRLSRQEARVLGVVAVLLVLTRPEALVWVPVLLGLCYLNRGRDESSRDAFRRVTPAAIAFVATAALLTIFRLAYFGFPLPNTFYAKVSPSLGYRLMEGGAYLASYVISSPVVFACAIAVIGSAAHLRRAQHWDGGTVVLNSVAATGFVVPVLTGGDHFDGFRFYQPVYPLLVLNLLNFASRVAPQYVPAPVRTYFGQRTMVVASAGGLGLCVVLQLVSWLSVDRSKLLGREFEIAVAGRLLGERADVVFGELHHRPDIATITVGGFKYAYQGDVIDLMGLNDTRMAHNGGDRVGYRSHAAFELRTFFELKPRLVIPLVQFGDRLSAVGRRDPFADRALKGLLDEPRFRERYELAEVTRVTSTGRTTVAGWYDRAFLAHLQGHEGLKVVVADRDYR